jgi:hypothetical protein
MLSGGGWCSPYGSTCLSQHIPGPMPGQGPEYFLGAGGSFLVSGFFLPTFRNNGSWAVRWAELDRAFQWMVSNRGSGFTSLGLHGQAV